MKVEVLVTLKGAVHDLFLIIKHDNNDNGIEGAILDWSQSSHCHADRLQQEPLSSKGAIESKSRSTHPTSIACNRSSAT